MTAPYYGLLDQSAVARMLAQMTGGANMPQQNNPTFGPTQGAMPQPPGLLQPTPPFNPNAQTEGGLMAQGRSTSPADDPNHEHRKGLRGKIRHLLGGDRIAPEVANLLNPDQKERLLNMSLLGQFGGGGEQDIALNMVGLTEMAEKRKMNAQQQQMMSQIQQVASTMPEQEGLEYTARMMARLGLPGYDKTAQAAEGLRKPQMQPMAVQIEENVLGADGKPYKVWTKGGTAEEIKREPQFVAPRGTASGAGQLSLSVGEQRSLGDLNYYEEAATDALTALANRPESVGLKNLMGVKLSDRVDPHGVMVRTKIATLSNQIRNGLFGAALSAREAELAAAQLATDTNTEESAEARLKEVLVFVEQKRRGLYQGALDTAEFERTGKIPTRGKPAGQPKGKPMSAQAYRDAKANGYTDEEIKAQGYIIPEDR